MAQTKDNVETVRDYQIGQKLDTLEMVPFCSLGKGESAADCRSYFHDTLTWEGLSSVLNSPPLLSTMHLESMMPLLDLLKGSLNLNLELEQFSLIKAR